MSKPLVIDQFTPSLQPGDGVSHSVFYTRRLLRKLGFNSTIYAGAIHESFASMARPVKEYQPGDDEALIVHHSILNDYEAQVLSGNGKKILAYHNITPDFFFEKDSQFAAVCGLGRQQLQQWAGRFTYAYADSSYNAEELLRLGYPQAVTLPLLLDFERIASITPDLEIASGLQDRFNILFVGRFAYNKCQHELLDLIFELERKGFDNLRLILAGATSNTEYEHHVRDKIQRHEGAVEVICTGPISDQALYGYYRAADLYVSLSNHEGFGIPLQEAVYNRVPVLAYRVGGIPTAVGDRGLTDSKSLATLAPWVGEYINSPAQRQSLLNSQQQHLARFTPQRLQAELADYLTGIGLLPGPPASAHEVDGELVIDSGLTDELVGGAALVDREVVDQEVVDGEVLDGEVVNAAKNIAATDNPAHQNNSVQIQGPCDSSYSLAQVNGQLALQLAKHYPTSVFITEGGGNYQPDQHWLAQHPEINQLVTDNASFGGHTVIRNLYPPRVTGVKADQLILGPYGWEESKFPRQYVTDINRYVSHVACMSEYVKKTLWENGITVPLTVTGIGVDAILSCTSQVCNLPSAAERAYTYLHISSAFPRKGIDILISAFSRVSQVKVCTLILKTFPNPHNDTENQLASLGWQRVDAGAEITDPEKNSSSNNSSSINSKDSANYSNDCNNSDDLSVDDGADKLAVDYYRHPQCAGLILWINQDLKEGQIKYLYEASDALVAPGRGEGFGLVMAEAMVLGVPVITTGYGGQMDFCSAETSWLVDYDMIPAATHMELAGSIWAEPRIDSLVEKMTQLAAAAPWELAAKTELARQRIIDNYSWAMVAGRISKLIETPHASPHSIAKNDTPNNVPNHVPNHVPNDIPNNIPNNVPNNVPNDIPNKEPQKLSLGLVTTWNTRCGIAEYSQSYVAHMSTEDIRVYAPYESPDILDEGFVARCWRSGGRNYALQPLLDQIIHDRRNTIWIQYNYSFFSLPALAQLIEALVAEGINVFLSLHATEAVSFPNSHPASLGQITGSLAKLSSIFVHSVADLNRLKQLGLENNTSVMMLPFDCPNLQDAGNSPKNAFVSQKAKDIKAWLASSDSPVVATFGFLLPHKGVAELIDACQILRRSKPARLLLLTAQHPAPASAQLEAALSTRIAALPSPDEVLLVTEYLPTDDVIALLADTCAVIYPYQRSQESASAAVKMAITAARRPLVTDLPIFDDLGELAIRTGFTSEDIATVLAEVIETGCELRPEDIEFISDNSWTVQATKVDNALCSALLGKKGEKLRFL